MKNFIVKYLSVLFVCLLALSFIFVTENSYAYSTNFNDSTYNTAWGIIGTSFDTDSNQLKFTSMDRNGDDLVFIPYSSPSRSVDVNYTVSVSVFDSSASRVNCAIHPNWLSNTTQSAWTSMPIFKMTLTGYLGNSYIEFFYNTTTIDSSTTISLNTEYHIGMGCYEAQNGTYFLVGKVWTSGSYSSPDIMDAIYWLSYVPPVWKYVTFGNHNIATASGTCSGYIKELSMKVIPYKTATNLFTFTPSPENSIQPAKCGEPNLIFNSTTNTLHMWFTSGTSVGGTTGGEYNTLWYCYATDSPYYDSFSTPQITNLQAETGRCSVVEYKGVYYLFGDDTTDSDVFLWSSTNGITWTLMNDNKPVINSAVSNTNPYYRTYNTGALIIENTCHLWIECGMKDNMQMYSSITMPTGTITNSTVFDFESNKTSEAVFNSQNVNPVYIEEYNAIILFTAMLDEPTGLYTKLQAYTVNASADLTKSENYIMSYNFSIGASLSTSASDMVTVFTEDLMIFQYFYGQPYTSDIRQFYGEYNETTFYEILTGISEPEPEPEPEPSNPSDYLKVGKVLIVLAGAIPFIGFIIWALGKKD